MHKNYACPWMPDMKDRLSWRFFVRHSSCYHYIKEWYCHTWIKTAFIYRLYFISPWGSNSKTHIKAQKHKHTIYVFARVNTLHAILLNPKLRTFHFTWLRKAGECQLTKSILLSLKWRYFRNCFEITNIFYTVGTYRLVSSRPMLFDMVKTEALMRGIIILIT